jgi:hypothetical protein
MDMDDSSADGGYASFHRLYRLTMALDNRFYPSTSAALIRRRGRSARGDDDDAADRAHLSGDGQAFVGGRLAQGFQRQADRIEFGNARIAR